MSTQSHDNIHILYIILDVIGNTPAATAHLIIINDYPVMRSVWRPHITRQLANTAAQEITLADD